MERWSPRCAPQTLDVRTREEPEDHKRENLRETGHPVFRGVSALNRGVLKRKGGICTSHFTAESSNTELLFRTIHSANQLSVHGAVASWCEDVAQRIPVQTHHFMEKSVAKENEQLFQKLEPPEVDSLVQTPRRNDEAVGNRLRMYLQNFEEFAKEFQFTKAFESAGCMRRVSSNAPQTTVFRLLRENPNSKIAAWTHQHWTSSSSQSYMLS